MPTTNISAEKNSKRSKKKNFGKVSILVLLLVWSGLVYGGYWFVEETLQVHREKMQIYVDETIKNVQETNALNLKELEEKLEGMQYEMKEIREALEKADESIQGSNSSREQLDEKMADLNEQLEELKESLDILKGSQQ